MYVCVPVLLIYSLLILLCSCLRRKSMRTQQGLRLATMQVMYHAVSGKSLREACAHDASPLHSHMIQAKSITRESERATRVHEELAAGVQVGECRNAAWRIPDTSSMQLDAPAEALARIENIEERARLLSAEHVMLLASASPLPVRRGGTPQAPQAPQAARHKRHRPRI